ncbi:hypothetical protein N1851_035158 [Merluccius polli]|uniref:Uncharacterized protein n=1 Tax=Merluccius polli TaxID=89951 RepID=A0AA47LZ16_MERPO|nr:hypothetical protein N1851_035158 [Merluccius polli]
MSAQLQSPNFDLVVAESGPVCNHCHLRTAHRQQMDRNVKASRPGLKDRLHYVREGRSKQFDIWRVLLWIPVIVRMDDLKVLSFYPVIDKFLMEMKVRFSTETNYVLRGIPALSPKHTYFLDKQRI